MVANLLSSDYEHTIYVVAKLLTTEWGWEIEVEDKAYWDKSYAQKRMDAVYKDPGIVECNIWPVRFWAAPVSVKSDNVPPPDAPYPLAIWGAVTQDEGLRLHAYAEDKQARLRLPAPLPRKPPEPDESSQLLAHAVSHAWLSWREQQATAGNFDEAAQAGPSTESLEAMYRSTDAGPPKQLELPLPGLTAPAH